jgi:lysophospholipase L1-like esterase
MITLKSRVLRAAATLLVAFASLVVTPVWLGAQAAPAQAQRTATADRWEPAIQKFEEQDRQTPLPRNEIVFVGSSSIVRWNLREFFPELGQNAINRGFGGSLLSDSVKYADRIVVPYKPRIVVLYAGDNDIEAGTTARQIAELFAEFEQKVHRALPDTRVIFISIKPSIRRWKWMDEIHAANTLVREYCATRPNLTFVDIEPQMLGPDGKPRPELLVEDGLHMTPEGYKIWTAALKPHLKDGRRTQ